MSVWPYLSKNETDEKLLLVALHVYKPYTVEPVFVIRNGYYLLLGWCILLLAAFYLDIILGVPDPGNWVVPILLVVVMFSPFLYLTWWKRASQKIRNLRFKLDHPLDAEILRSHNRI